MTANKRQVLFKGDDGHACFALAVLSEAEGFHTRVAAEHILYGGAQFACAVAVHDAHLLQIGNDCRIEKVLCLGNALGSRHADQVALPLD